MTLEELISEVNKRGLRINNLFQLEDQRWQANITDGERYWEFGKGPDANAALSAALHMQQTTEPEMGRPQKSTAIIRKSNPDDISGIMGVL